MLGGIAETPEATETMSAMSSVLVNVRLPAPLHAALRDRATAEDRSAASVVRAALRTLLEADRPRPTT